MKFPKELPVNLADRLVVLKRLVLFLVESASIYSLYLDMISAAFQQLPRKIKKKNVNDLNL